MEADWLRDNPAGLVAYWLLPAASDAERLAARIGALAKAHDAPCFEPHVTLLVATLAPAPSPRFVLDTLSQEFEPFEAATGRAQHTAALFKSLYLPVHGKEPTAMHRRIVELGSRSISEDRFDPHLSLLYKELPERRRASLAASEPFGGTRIAFDRVAAILPAPGHHDFADVGGWREAESRPLCAHPTKDSDCV